MRAITKFPFLLIIFHHPISLDKAYFTVPVPHGFEGDSYYIRNCPRSVISVIPAILFVVEGKVPLPYGAMIVCGEETGSQKHAAGGVVSVRRPPRSLKYQK